MTDNLYACADVGRTGLGNMLLPWARCEVFRHRHGIPMLAPRWTQLKIGPLLRGEKDKRYYVGLFNQRRYLRGLSKLAVLLAARRVPEREFAAAEAAGTAPSAGKILVVFSGLEGFFTPLLAHRELIRSRLTGMLAPQIARRLAEQPTDFVIGAHVRRGDKPVVGYGQPQTSANQGMPTQWFIGCIQNLRQALGTIAPVRVFSDARPDELRELLSMPNVSLAPDNPSIVDMLALARSRILIGSAHSTFSLWAAYLGRMPALWYPGGAPGLHPDAPQLEAETDLEGNVTSEFAAALNISMNRDLSTTAPTLALPRSTGGGD